MGYKVLIVFDAFVEEEKNFFFFFAFNHKNFSNSNKLQASDALQILNDTE